MIPSAIDMNQLSGQRRAVDVKVSMATRNQGLLSYSFMRGRKGKINMLFFNKSLIISSSPR